MKIKSKTDVITNSSDEVFVFRSDRNPEEVRKDILDILGPDHSTSGMAGTLDIADSKTPRNYIPPGYLVMDLDNAYVPDLVEFMDLGLFGQELSDDEITREVLIPIKNSIYIESYRRVTENWQGCSNPESLDAIIELEKCQRWLKKNDPGFQAKPVPIQPIMAYVRHLKKLMKKDSVWPWSRDYYAGLVERWEKFADENKK